ncbi:hypothetical protein PLICRDRAFT_57065 [Plicaturopsis crispa FD-325 SS-3]|uniref:Uncharacterized protein n=1 Tax=Plicaturopsis crispa FD-325 SS-3 TaxID=944288 RepID=A0A0C9SLA2_PLICR|nr:hypothetical protein PLICRDRAFT_57065 [Plicaturopsis crispa FD-325 SS-3]
MRASPSGNGSKNGGMELTGLAGGAKGHDVHMSSSNIGTNDGGQMQGLRLASLDIANGGGK